MANYSIIIFPPAKKDLDAIKGKMLDRLEDAILKLELNPRPTGSKKLKGKEDLFRLRAGNFRILYVVDDAKKRVLVYRVAHRREAYR